MLYLEKAFQKKNKLKWEYVYIAIDLHGTIIKPNKETLEFYPAALRTLKYLSTREDVKLILFTSTYQSHIEDVFSYLVDAKVYFDYVNENPEIDNNERSDFNKKFHFDVLFDDKAGFNPLKDWEQVYTTVQQFE